MPPRYRRHWHELLKRVFDGRVQSKTTFPRPMSRERHKKLMNGYYEGMKRLKADKKER